MRGVSKMWALGLPLMLTLGACDDDDGDTTADSGMGSADSGVDSDAATEKSVEVVFEARVGEETFACDATYAGLGTTEASASPLDFRMYVHDVRLITADGNEEMLQVDDSDFSVDGVTLLDFEDNSGTCINGNSATNDRVTGTVPEGDYVGLAFTVGVPETLNHENPATAGSPLNLLSMHWSWAGGYKYVRFDFSIDTAADGDGAPFNFHLGSTACEGDPEAGDSSVTCGNANRPDITLDAFDVDADKVVIDYAALVADEDLDEDLGGAPGCMSGGTDGDCESVFEAMALDLATGEVQGDQKVFSAEAQ